MRCSDRHVRDTAAPRLGCTRTRHRRRESRSGLSGVPGRHFSDAADPHLVGRSVAPVTWLHSFELHLLAMPQRLSTNCTEEGSCPLVEVPDRKLKQLDAEVLSPVDHYRREESASAAATRFIHYRDLVELNPTDRLRERVIRPLPKYGQDVANRLVLDVDAQPRSRSCALRISLRLEQLSIERLDSHLVGLVKPVRVGVVVKRLNDGVEPSESRSICSRRLTNGQMGVHKRNHYALTARPIARFAACPRPPVDGAAEPVLRRQRPRAEVCRRSRIECRARHQREPTSPGEVGPVLRVSKDCIGAAPADVAR